MSSARFSHAHLLHHAAAMDLDGFFGGTEVAGDLLVESADHHLVENLQLARSEAREALQDDLPLRVFIARHGVPLQRPLDNHEEFRRVDRLGQEVDRSGSPPFQELPPRQAAASFSLEEVMEKLSTPGGAQ